MCAQVRRVPHARPSQVVLQQVCLSMSQQPAVLLQTLGVSALFPRLLLKSELHAVKKHRNASIDSEEGNVLQTACRRALMGTTALLGPQHFTPPTCGQRMMPSAMVYLLSDLPQHSCAVPEV